MAIENITKRNQLFMKAARAFSGKGYGSGGVAFFYSQEGKSYDSKVKQWNARAAQATLMQNQLRVHDSHTVDLHGLTVAQALAVVKDTVNDWYSREEMKSGRSYFKPLTIITGLGNNSPSYNSRLGPAVTNRLIKEGWKLDVSRKGFVIVKGVRM
ncbi:hypothetical protein K7432_016247 [Basidiobolus ranarum]|uniref:Smr domain-containing protein n=1 Tax=Basidiobolus ranarum TaxID=34480 RepID=A0ABR2WEZ6_9FUNG